MSSALPAGWKQITSPDGRAYYHNQTTGETTWSPPSGGAPAPSAPPVSGKAAPAAASALQTAAVPPAAQSTKGGQYTLQSLVSNTGQRDLGQGMFELERDKLLEINLGQYGTMAWIKAGSMVARRGKVKFTRQGMGEQGFGKLMKKAFTGEGVTFVKCEGRGKVFCADQGKLISVIHLNNESISVNGNDVLAMSETLKYDIKFMKSAGMLAGGLFNVKVKGTGYVAFTCHGAVVTLTASAQDPIYSDPDATVAWTHDPTLKSDISMKALVGRGSGEEVQLCFTEGHVIVQPYEEIYQTQY